MKLQHDFQIGQNLVTAVGAGFVNVNGIRHEASLLLLPQRIEPGWGAAGFEALSEADFAQIVEIGCDVLLFGTGSRQRFPQPALLRALMAARIGVEIMDTAAACRTYNFLVLEGRNAAAALLLD
jgi:uncharacterized protein